MPEPWAVYGPGMVCHLDYGVRIGANEAAIYEWPFFGVLPFGTGWELGLDTDYDLPDERRRPLGELHVAGLGSVARIERVHPFGSSTDAPREIVYLLPALTQRRGIVVSSRAFDGTERDRHLLRRVEPVRGGCPELRPRGPNSMEAADWSPVLYSGPDFVCLESIGFPVRSGEQYQLSWSGRDRDGARLVIGDARIEARASIAPTAGFPPGRVIDHIFIFTPRTFEDGYRANIYQFTPPRRAAEGQESPQPQITIAYREGQDQAVGSLLARLEFVAADDPRCRS